MVVVVAVAVVVVVVVPIVIERLEKKIEERPSMLRAYPHMLSCRSEDEFINNSYVPSLFALFWNRSVRMKMRERERIRRNGKKKIAHPIADARGCNEFCRLACTSLSAAGGHDWSKTENEEMEEKRNLFGSVHIQKAICLTNKKRDSYMYFIYMIQYICLFSFFSIKIS